VGVVIASIVGPQRAVIEPEDAADWLKSSSNKFRAIHSLFSDGMATGRTTHRWDQSLGMVLLCDAHVAGGDALGITIGRSRGGASETCS